MTLRSPAPTLLVQNVQVHGQSMYEYVRSTMLVHYLNESACGGWPEPQLRFCATHTIALQVSLCFHEPAPPTMTEKVRRVNS